MRVLVVDDEPAVRDRAAAGARPRGLRGRRSRRTAARRWTASATARYDAIVLDVAMPRLDGLEVCRRLRAAGDRTPVLMLTARDAVDDRVAGLDAGADDYLVKPFALEELKRAAARAAAPRRRPDGRAALRRPGARPVRPRGPARRAARSSSRAPSSSCWSCSSRTRARC